MRLSTDVEIFGNDLYSDEKTRMYLDGFNEYINTLVESYREQSSKLTYLDVVHLTHSEVDTVSPQETRPVTRDENYRRKYLRFKAEVGTGTH